jgi:hypothetical protein
MDQARHLAATGIKAHLACLFHAPLRGGDHRRAGQQTLALVRSRRQPGRRSRTSPRSVLPACGLAGLADANASGSRDDRERRIALPDTAATKQQFGVQRQTAWRPGKPQYSAADDTARHELLPLLPALHAERVPLCVTEARHL